MNRPARADWVLDTNVVLDWLVFNDPRMARMARALDEGRARIATRADCREELRRVLDYAHLPLAPEERPAILARYDASSDLYDGPADPAILPRCRDATDQKFLELARDAGVRWLVSKDRALLRLATRVATLHRFDIVDPESAERLVAFPSAVL